MSSMSSDFVMLRSPSTRISPPLHYSSVRPAAAPCHRRPAIDRTILLTGDLLLQEIPEAGAGRGVGAVVLHRLRLLMRFLRLDRERNGADLAVHRHEARLDLIARLEHRAGVLDAIAGQLRGTEISLDPAAQIHHRALGVDVLYQALHDGALRVLRDPGRERVLRQLLDAERDTLALRVDRDHDGLDRLALLVAAHGFLPGNVPGEV